MYVWKIGKFVDYIEFFFIIVILIYFVVGGGNVDFVFQKVILYVLCFLQVGCCGIMVGVIVFRVVCILQFVNGFIILICCLFEVSF